MNSYHSAFFFCTFTELCLISSLSYRGQHSIVLLAARNQTVCTFWHGCASEIQVHICLTSSILNTSWALNHSVGCFDSLISDLHYNLPRCRQNTATTLSTSMLGAAAQSLAKENAWKGSQMGILPSKNLGVVAVRHRKLAWYNYS